jgi:hypothetical protein
VAHTRIALNILIELLRKMGIKARDLLRQNEEVYKRLKLGELDIVS